MAPDNSWEPFIFIFMNSIITNCKIDSKGIYIPKEFIEEWYSKLEDRKLKYDGLFTQGRFVGGMDVLGDLLEVINETNNK